MTDGMDQSRSILPYSKLKYSAIESATKQKFHLFGAYNFSQKLTIYTDIGEYSHNTNMNITAIINVSFKFLVFMLRLNEFGIFLPNTFSFYAIIYSNNNSALFKIFGIVKRI